MEMHRMRENEIMMNKKIVRATKHMCTNHKLLPREMIVKEKKANEWNAMHTHHKPSSAASQQEYCWS